MANKNSKGAAATPPKSAKKSIAEAISEVFQRDQPQTTVEQVRIPAEELGSIELPPIVERIARDLYQRMGRHLCPTFDAWKLAFFDIDDPCHDVIHAEISVRAFENFMARHPDAKPTGAAASICFPSANLNSENGEASMREIQELICDAWNQVWIPLTSWHIELPSDGPLVVLEYNEVIEELDGLPYPNLRGEIDPRPIIDAADIVGITDSGSKGFFCLYGSEHLDEQGHLPDGKMAVLVNLNMQDKTKDQLDKLVSVVQMIKGRC